MNQTRILRFEVMEPRIALSANASDLLAELQTDIAANGSDPQRVHELLVQIAKTHSESPISPPTTPLTPLGELGDALVVRFRVDIRDMQDQPVNAVQVGQEYLARVFVQDVRDLAAANLAKRGNGGVFQAWVDLEFSTNLHPTGNIRLNEAFDGSRLDPEINGSFLRNLGGVARDHTPSGGAEQFLFDAPFVVDSVDAPSRIQVAASTSQPEPVLVFGFNRMISNDSIRSPGFDLPSATNNDATGSSRPPVNDPFDGSSPKPNTPTPPSAALPNSGRSSHGATSGDDSVSLVSYIPFLRNEDSPSRLKWRDDDDWLRQKRLDDENIHDDGWKDVDYPDEEGQSLETKSLNRGDSSSADDSESDEAETDDDHGKRKSKHAGLFYDETLFLEGALVETFQSKFRLHFQTFAPQRQTNEGTSDSIAHKKKTPPDDGFIDIAEILTPNQDTKPWQENVDEAIAGHRVSPSPTHQAPAIDWGTIEPFPATTTHHQPGKQIEANQKLPDQRTPLAMNPSVNGSSDTGPPPTVQ